MTSLNTCLRSNCQVQAGGANGAVTMQLDQITDAAASQQAEDLSKAA